MFLLVLGIAAAIGMIAWVAFGLLSLVNDGVRKHDEAFRGTGGGEPSLSEKPA